jgi:FAD synthase
MPFDSSFAKGVTVHFQENGKKRILNIKFLGKDFTFGATTAGKMQDASTPLVV